MVVICIFAKERVPVQADELNEVRSVYIGTQSLQRYPGGTKCPFVFCYHDSIRRWINCSNQIWGKSRTSRGAI